MKAHVGLRVIGAVAIAFAVAPTPTAHATNEPGVAALAPAALQGPWTDPAYTPSPDNWQPYVLAPSSRVITPAAVQQSKPQGGAIAGDPKDVLTTDGKGVTLTGTGAPNVSPLLTVDFGQDVGGYVELHLLPGPSSTIPEVHVCFSESTRYMAAPTAAQDQEGYSAPGCDMSNILNGFNVATVAEGHQVMPWLWDSESHTLTGSRKVTSPTAVTDSQLRGGFRYATIFLNGAGSVSIDSVSLHFAAAPN